MVTRLARIFLLAWVLLFSLSAGAGGDAVGHALPTPGVFMPALHASAIGRQFDSAQAALQDYRAGRFEALPSNLGRGYRKDDVWLAFDLDKHTQPDGLYVLEVAPAFLDRVSAFLVSGNGEILALGQAGDQVPQDQNGLPSFKPAFVLPPQPTGARTVLLHIETSSTQSAIVSLYRMEDFVAQSATQGVVFGTVFAISIFILLMSAGLYALQRNNTYLFWFGYVSSTTGLWLCIDGVGYRYFPIQDLALLNAASSVLGALSMAFALLLVTRLFDFKRIARLLHRVLVYWAWFLILATLGGLMVNTLFVPGSLYLVTMPLLLVCVVLIVVQIAQGDRQSRLYGVPFIGFVSFSVYNLMANFGWVTYSFTSLYGWQIAGVLNLVSLQLAFLDQARRKDLQYKAEHNYFLKLLAHKNAELEERVSARTHDLQQALEQVSRSEAEQRQLLSMASHEFRTPAAVIKASLDSLQYLQAQIPPEVSQRLENMRLASQRMVGLANDLISQDRLQNRDLDPTNKQRIDLCELVQETCSMFTREPWLQIQLPPGPIWMDADPALIRIALNNLILNAQRHAQGEERGVSVRIADTDEGYILLQVLDQGPGIAAADRARVFERFVSGSTGSSAVHSSGLGLSIVQNIARSHAGSVYVGDNHPKGSIFTLRLPTRTRSGA